MGTRREEEDEPLQGGRGATSDEMKEFLANMDKWGWISPSPIYATAGVCYICCELMPEPPDEKKELTLSDVVCDGCKEAGFWK